jgi:hypothetical protein
MEGSGGRHEDWEIISSTLALRPPKSDQNCGNRDISPHQAVQRQGIYAEPPPPLIRWKMSRIFWYELSGASRDKNVSATAPGIQARFGGLRLKILWTAHQITNPPFRV